MIYFVRNTETRMYKIGYTDRPIRHRLSALQVGSGAKLSVEWFGDGTREDEAALHEMFSASRRKGEWFEVSHLMRIVLLLLPTLGVRGILEHGKETLLTFMPTEGPFLKWWLQYKDRVWWPKWTDEGLSGWRPAW